MFEEPGTLVEEGLRQDEFGRALVTNTPVYIQELNAPLSTALKSQSLVFIGDQDQVLGAGGHGPICTQMWVTSDMSKRVWDGSEHGQVQWSTFRHTNVSTIV